MKTILGFILFLLAVPAPAQVAIGSTGGGNVQLGGGGAGGVTAIVPGSNTSCTPFSAGNCVGSVTVNATAGTLIPANAELIFGPTSVNDDDQEVNMPAITITSYSQSGSTLTINNSGINNISVGDWVNMRYLSDHVGNPGCGSSCGNWPACPSPLLLGTGCTLFRAVTASSTQITINVGSLTIPTCTSSCATYNSAMNNFPFLVSEQPGMPGPSHVVVLLPTDVTIRGMASDWTALYHPYSTAVTGNPAYFVINNFTNDVGISPTCMSAATIRANYTTIFEAIHTDLSVAVYNSAPAVDYAQNTGCNAYYQTFNALQNLMEGSGRTASTAASGDYWDISADWGKSYNDPNSPYYSGTVSGGWRQASSALVNSLVAGNGFPLPYSIWFWGAPVGSTNTSANGLNMRPSADGFRAFGVMNHNMDTQLQYWNTSQDVVGFNAQVQVTGSTNGTSQPLAWVQNTTGSGFLNNPNLGLDNTATGGSQNTNLNCLRIGAGYNLEDSFLCFDYESSGTPALNSLIGKVDYGSYDSFHACGGGLFAVYVNTANQSSGGQQGCPTSNPFSVGTTGQYSVDTSGNQYVEHINQTAAKNSAGSCTMSTTSCTFSLNTAFTSTPICIATVQSATVVAGGCTVSGTTVTITAASSNTSTWGAILIGNPN